MGFGSGDAGADMIQSWRESGDKMRDGEPCDAVDEFGPEIAGGVLGFAGGDVRLCSAG